jgi:hypothetical protein
VKRPFEGLRYIGTVSGRGHNHTLVFETHSERTNARVRRYAVVAVEITPFGRKYQVLTHVEGSMGPIQSIWPTEQAARQEFNNINGAVEV